MTSKDVVEMYKKGYSIDYIVDTFYKFKTKDDIPNHKINDTFIVTKKSITKDKAKNDVENTILKFALSNKAN